MSIQVKSLSKINLNVDSNYLEVTFSVNSSKAVYDICSLEGRILKTGEIEKGNQTLIDISSFQNGLYNLFILDSGEVHKEQFSLAS